MDKQCKRQGKNLKKVNNIKYLHAEPGCDAAGLSLSDARGTDRVGALANESKTEGGSHPRNFNLFV